jgi:hypothetical protein
MTRYFVLEVQRLEYAVVFYTLALRIGKIFPMRNYRVLDETRERYFIL